MIPIDIVDRLRNGGLRVRTAIWLLPVAEMSQLADKAARLRIGLADVRQPIMARIAPEQQFLRLGVREIIEALDVLCQDEQANDCLLVANGDLLVARLNYRERIDFWDILYRGFPHRPRALLMAFPQGADALLPSKPEIDQWKKEDRFVP